MFSFVDKFEQDENGSKDAKIQTIPPLFNSRNILEWSLPPDKRFLCFSKTWLRFYIDIPSNYTVDNDVCSKLFENIEISLSHETITHKSSSIDNPFTNFLLHKSSYDESYMRTTMVPNGWFDSKNFDSGDVRTAKLEKGRNLMAEPITKTIMYENTEYTVNYHRFYLRNKVIPIKNHIHNFNSN